MINIIKNLNFGGVVALVAMMMLTVSWQDSKVDLAAPQWYNVTITGSDPDPLKNQVINPAPQSAPAGDCQGGETTLCAVLLEVTSGPFPTNMYDAENSSAVTITSRQHKD